MTSIFIYSLERSLSTSLDNTSPFRSGEDSRFSTYDISQSEDGFYDQKLFNISIQKNQYTFHRILFPPFLLSTISRYHTITWALKENNGHLSRYHPSENIDLLDQRGFKRSSTLRHLAVRRLDLKLGIVQHLNLEKTTAYVSFYVISVLLFFQQSRLSRLRQLLVRRLFLCLGIIQHFNLEKPAYVSPYAISTLLSFNSQQLVDIRLLGSRRSSEDCPLLRHHPSEVIDLLNQRDFKILYFMTRLHSSRLTRRSEILSEDNFVINSRLSTKNTKADI